MVRILPLLFLTLLLQTKGTPQIISEVYTYKNIPIIIKLSLTEQQKSKKIQEKIFQIITNQIYNYEYNEGSYIKNVTESAYRKPTKIDKDLSTLLSKILYYNSLTKSISPTIGYLIDIWGFESEKFYIPSPEEISNALKISSTKNLIISENTIALKNKKTKFYLKPFAAGIAAEKIKTLLLSENIQNALISIGNNFSLCLGKKEQNKWNIGISRYQKNIDSETLLTLEISDETVYTASIYENYFIERFKTYHSLIDPKTGYPADNGTILVTVVHKDPVEAIILARALLVMGKDAGMKFSEKIKIKALFVTSEDNRTRIYKTSLWSKTFDRDTTQKPLKR